MPQARWVDSGLFVLVLTKLRMKREKKKHRKGVVIWPGERKYLVKIVDSNLLKSSDSINDDRPPPHLNN